MQYLDKNGLKTFLNQLKETFGLKSTIDIARNALDTYVLNIDYTQLEFDTDFIVSGGASSSVLVVGQLGVMILGT